MLHDRFLRQYLKEDENKVFFQDFLTALKDFLKQLLNDPLHAEVGEFFEKHGITRDDLVKKLKSYAIVTSKTNIKEVPKSMDENCDGENAMHGVRTLSYKVKGKRFGDKTRVLFKELFAENKKDNVKKIRITEEQLKLLMTETGEGDIGAFTFDAPALSDEPTQKRSKDFKNGTMTTQHVDDEDSSIIRKQPYMPKQNK